MEPDSGPAIELLLLSLAALLGLVHSIAASQSASLQRGYRVPVGAGERPLVPLTGAAARLERAMRNYIETFPLFAAMVLAAIVVHREGDLTFWGTHLYFWGRLAYLVFSARDRPVARALAWNVATIGIVAVGAALWIEPAPL